MAIARRRSPYGSTGAPESATRTAKAPVPCPDCGAPLGGQDGCRARFETLSVRAASDLAYARLHRLAVDASALQHPDEYCRSAKSLAAHLTGVCAAVEQGAETDRINNDVQRWLSRNPPLERPTPPASHGTFTIGDLGTDLAAVRTWAACVWEAWIGLPSSERSYRLGPSRAPRQAPLRP